MKNSELIKKDQPFLETHALAAYFIAVFILSWGAILLFIGPDALPASVAQAQSIGMALLLGPTGAMVLLTAIIDGRAGFRKLGARLKHWRVGGRYYAVALLMAPATAMATLLVLSLFDPQFTPKIIAADGKAQLMGMGIGAGLFIAFFEELGWTGFAVPRLLKRHGMVYGGVLTGALWGLWHFPPFWQSDSFSGALPLALLLARLFTWIVAYRVLMVWLYKRTESLPAVILMHMSLVVCMIAIEPPLQGRALLTYILSWTAVLWAVVGIGGMLTQRADAKK